MLAVPSLLAPLTYAVTVASVASTVYPIPEALEETLSAKDPVDPEVEDTVTAN